MAVVGHVSVILKLLLSLLVVCHLHFTTLTQGIYFQFSSSYGDFIFLRQNRGGRLVSNTSIKIHVKKDHGSSLFTCLISFFFVFLIDHAHLVIDLSITDTLNYVA